MNASWQKAKIYVAIWMGAVGLVACSNLPDYTSEIKAIDSLLVEVDTSLSRAEQISKSFPMADSVLMNVRIFQENYQGVMSEAMAKTLNSYAVMQKNMVSLGDFSQTLRNQMEDSRNRILDLRQALNEGATHDIYDNKLTKETVIKALSEEKKNMIDLIEDTDNMIKESNEILQLYSDLNPQIEAWGDSLFQIKR